MLSNVRWGKFKLGDLFDIKNTYSFNTDSLVDGNKYDYVTRTSLNNGVLQETGFINDENLNESGIWSLGLLQMDFFYRKREWYAGQFVRKIIPKIKLTDKSVLYFTTVLNSIKNKLLSVLVRYVDEEFKNSVVGSPISNENTIDFDFMDTFISELEAYHISELEAYLLVTGLKNYKLNKNELQVVEKIQKNEVKWEKVRIVDRFSVKNTSNILSEEIVENSGETPYLGATSQNNGILSYITYDETYKDSGECVFIGGKTFVVTYQENDFYSNDSHNLVLYYNDIVQKNKLNNLFFCTSIKKSLGHKYSWGNSISKSKIQSDYMMLPVDEKDDIDYDFMKNLISAVQKLVIKDVVLYSDEKIKATKHVINNKVNGNKIIKDTIFDKKLAAHIDVGNLIDKLDSD